MLAPCAGAGLLGGFVFFLKMQGQPTDGFLPVSLPKPNFPTFSLATRSTKPNTPTKGDPTENLRSKLNRCVRLSTHEQEHRATGCRRYVSTGTASRDREIARLEAEHERLLAGGYDPSEDDAPTDVPDWLLTADAVNALDSLMMAPFPALAHLSELAPSSRCPVQR